MGCGSGAGITAHTCGYFALLPRCLVESSGEISLQLREGDGCLTSGGVARGEVFLVDGVPLVLVLGGSLAAADTHVPVLAADLEFEVAVPFNDDLSHTLHHAVTLWEDTGRWKKIELYE